MLTKEQQKINDKLHQIELLENKENGGIYIVIVKMPFKIGWVENMKLHIWNDIKEMEFQMKHIVNDKDVAFYQTEIFLETSAIYHYCFSFELNGKIIYYKKNYITDKLNDNECWKLSVGFDVPEWAKDKMMYHIFVDRYRKGKGTKLEKLPNRTIHKKWNESPVMVQDENGRWNTDFFGGNLKGIEETLDYIKSLGTSIIYLSPIVKSQSNHRYDSADYEVVDPYVGTNSMLKELCEKAHEKGMYIVLDAVFNHTGNDSKYFNEYGTYKNLGAYQSKKSPYYKFYKKYIDENGKENFSYWWGMKNLPVCDGNSPEWRKYILGEGGIIDKWFSLGVDGLRLDVADELTDDFISGIRNAVHRNKKDGFIIGEVWKNPMRMNRRYISSGKCMDSVMDYLLVDSLIRYYKYGDVDKLKNTINEILTEYPDGTIHTLMNFTSTHDISRLIEICGCDCFKRDSEWAWNLEDESNEFAKNHKMTDEQLVIGKMIIKSYITSLALMPGIFSIFYGDEIGLEGIGNLMNRCTFNWKKQDNELLEFFKEIGKLKNKYKFLVEADLNLVNVTDKYFIYERKTENKSILVITSRVNSKLNNFLPEDYKNWKIAYSVNGSNKDILEPYGAIILENKYI